MGYDLLRVGSVKHVSIYPRKDSPYLWVAYWSAKSLRRVLKKTPFRADDPQAKRKALNWAQPLAIEAAVVKKGSKSERWEVWVAPWLRAQYSASPKTLKRYLGAWAQWLQFLTERGIYIPDGMDHNAVVAFVDWRRAQKKPSSGRSVGQNTALADVRLMSIVMQEAIRRGFAKGNPCFRTGMKKDPAKEKAEMTDEDVAMIRAKLPAWVAQSPAEYGWMPVAFEIAIHQGCRLRETQLDLRRDVDLVRGTVMFHAKGSDGKPHVFTTTLHPKLRPLLARLIAEKKKVACVVPLMGSRMWLQFLASIDLPHLSFHCTRVTVITRMARAGVPVSQAMRFVGHASETVHRIYQKLKTEDLAACIAAVDV